MPRAELLRSFASKAGCVHTQRKAESLWKQLAPLLTEYQRTRLYTAWGHHVDCREGRSELDWVAEQIRKEWAGEAVSASWRASA